MAEGQWRLSVGCRSPPREVPSKAQWNFSEDDNGKPYFVLSGRAAKLAEGLSLHLSMSHEREEAVAMVVAEYEK